MGHAGNIRSITLDAYSKGLAGGERVDAVTRVVAAVVTEPKPL